MVGKQVVRYIEAHITEVENRKHGSSSGITLTERMDLPQPRYELGDMVHKTVSVYFRIIEPAFLLQVVFNSFTNIRRRNIEHRISTEYPLLFCDIIIADLPCKLEYTVEYPTMNRCQSDKRKSEGLFGKKPTNIGRCRICFMRFRIFGSTCFFRLVVTLYELLGFVDCNFALDVLARGFNQVFGRLQPVDGLQADSSLPRISFLPLLRLALAYIFIEVDHTLALKTKIVNIAQ